MNSAQGYLIGVDAGGTSTRAVLLDLAGQRVGSGTAGGANPNSHPVAQAAAAVNTALRAALGKVDPAQVRGGVLGIAGASKLTDPSVAVLFQQAWRSVGFAGPMRAISDCEAAFAAGTPEPDGTALVAGTGSIAARIVGRTLVSASGGHGWLLGDEGSAYWLGREAVRATLRQVEAGQPLGPLAVAVLAAAEVPADVSPTRRRLTVSKLITAANAEPPVHLARHAPLVSTAAIQGDPAAVEIVDRAARLLVTTARAARQAGERTPVVLIGSLVGPDSPLGDRLRAELTEGCGWSVRTATDGAAGAAWLAALDLLSPDRATATALHAAYLPG